MSGEPDRAAGPRIDSSVPHSARIWNYWLGGKDNYAADRQAGDAWLATDPNIAVFARHMRGFLHRSIRYLVTEGGVRQFLDVGTGLPTAGNTHEVAQGLAPECRIVYVDNDPLVLAHARALLTSTPEGATRYLHADMHDSDTLITGAKQLLDPTKPVAVMFNGVLGHVTDTAKVQVLIHGLLDRMSSGSYLAISDGTEATTELGRAAEQAQRAYAETGAVPYWKRPVTELASLFDGLEWVEPGLVSIPQWRPDEPDDPTTPTTSRPAPIDGHAGVARKP
jgi:hypothetical protein